MDEYITTRRGEQYELSDLVNFHLHSARAHSESVRSSRSRASAFGDARLGKSYSAIISGMVANKSCSVPQLSGSDAALSRRAYRFVHHDQVGPSELMAHSTRINVSDWAGEELLLVLEDITQLNLSLHRSPARESWKQTMGGLSDGTVGIHLLAGLMMGAQSGLIHGLFNLAILERLNGAGNSAQREKLTTVRLSYLPFEQRPARIWHEGVVDTLRGLDVQARRRLCFVADREAQGYEVLRMFQHESGESHFLVRCRSGSRRVRQVDQAGRLSTKVMCFKQVLESIDWIGQAEIKLPKRDFRTKSGKRRRQRERTACLHIRSARVRLERPRRIHARVPDLDRTLTLIEVRELNHQLVSEYADEKPLHGYLPTTPLVEGIGEQRLQNLWRIVGYYLKRWNIEQFFRLLKKEGLRVETSQLRTPEAVKKMVILAAKAAEQAMQLVQAFQEQGPQLTPVQTLFDAEDERTLDLMDRELAARGKSATNHNPHPVGSLKRAAWTIARHGGWLGYEKSAKPRPATMLRGLEKMRYLRRFVEHLDPDDS